ncbi:hypothetical protein ACJJH9_11360 [Microbulbifer sp. DLAB2-AF]|uniref:hypothetical protein n=1 Tax=Microbulbifer sp. DLAB2-AF TaxID=3243395 RepID=UPI00403915B6
MSLIGIFSQVKNRVMRGSIALFFLVSSQFVFSEGTGEELQELIDTSCLNDGFVRLDKDYRISQSVYIKCDMDSQNKTVYVDDGTIKALIVEGLDNAKLVLPNVINASADPGNGKWTGSGTGISLINISSSHIEIGHVRNFDYGVTLIGNEKGTVYNNIHIRHLENNRRNLVLQPWNKGWVNQNNFYGGRYSHWSNEGAALSGVSHIVLAEDNLPDNFGPPNNNSWYGASLEGSVPKYAVEIKGTYNAFYNSRWESVNGIWLQEGSWGNVIHFGYGVERLLDEDRVVGDLSVNKVISAIYK